MCASTRHVLIKEAREFYNIDMSSVLKMPQLSCSRESFLQKAFYKFVSVSPTQT